MKVCCNPDCAHQGEPQPLDNFRNASRNFDGKQPRCKDCMRLTDQAYRGTEARRESLRKYDKSEKGRATKRQYLKGTERNSAYQRRYYQSEKGKLNIKRRDQKKAIRYKQDPEFRLKVLARCHVHYHVQAGTIPPVTTLPCAKCNISQGEEYHHYLGYEREHWLDVEPICIKCHRNLEPEER